MTTEDIIELAIQGHASTRDAIRWAMEQEPVAWYLPSEEGYDSIFRDHSTVAACTGNKWEGFQPLYTDPKPRQWVGLTEVDVDELAREMVKGDKSVNWLARAIEAKLREKNA